jgi:hypothetical protein
MPAPTLAAAFDAMVLALTPHIPADDRPLFDARVASARVLCERLIECDDAGKTASIAKQYEAQTTQLWAMRPPVVVSDDGDMPPRRS